MENIRKARKIADLDINDKPREKALNLGVENLTNAELMAIILGSGLPGRSVIELSQDILGDNDNKLSQLCRMSVHELTSKYPGVGPAKAISLMAAIELGARCVHSLGEENTSPTVTSSSVVNDFMRRKLERKNHEEFWILFLSRANKILSAECVSTGGTASTLVDVKLVMKRALDKLASALILVHNHPSGNLRPSKPDDDLTKKISEAGKILDIRVLDHIIITPSEYYSYADEGRL